MTITPSVLILASRILRSFDLTVSGRLEDLMSNLRWMAVETLLTFCPPGPLARIAENSIWFSGMSETRTITQTHWVLAPLTAKWRVVVPSSPEITAGLPTCERSGHCKCEWCPGPDLNRHDRNDRGILSPLCLPISPPGQKVRCSGRAGYHAERQSQPPSRPPPSDLIFSTRARSFFCNIARTGS